MIIEDGSPLEFKHCTLECVKALACEQCGYGYTLPDEILEHYRDENGRYTLDVVWCPRCWTYDYRERQKDRF